MTLDQIPADQEMLLDENLDRMFKFAGCEPACHACHRKIPVGEKFKLVSLDGNDEMLCSKCDWAALVKEKTRQNREAVADAKRRQGGGFSRPSRARLGLS